MAFNIHFPNETSMRHINWLDPDFQRLAAKKGLSFARKEFGIWRVYSSFDIREKLGNISPSLSLQKDVLFPNAYAAVCATGGTETPGETGTGIYATGCRGNQIQYDYPLKPKLPFAVPLVQYPSPATIELHPPMESDPCALPVINWENYIRQLKIIVPYTSKQDLTGKSESGPKKRSVGTKTKHVLPKKTTDQVYKALREECDKLGQEGANEPKDSPELVSSLTNAETYKNLPGSLKTTLKPRWYEKDTVSNARTKLFKSTNPTSAEADDQTKGTSSTESEKIELKHIRNNFSIDRSMINNESLRRIKNIPKPHLQASWNYLFSGANGNCSVLETEDGLEIFCGNRNLLRRVKIEKSPKSMLSYKLNSVWQEPGSNCTYLQDLNNVDFFSDMVLQSVTIARHNFIAVRRGLHVDLYNAEEDVPYRIDRFSKAMMGFCKPQSLLVGLDTNPQYGAEIVTIDDCKSISVYDFVKGSVTCSESLPKEYCRRPKIRDFPQFYDFNSACGINFGHNGQTLIAWSDSQVYWLDRRENHNSTELFNLRRSVSSLSWSDQKYFNDSTVCLNEYMSAVSKSKYDHYYYIGTTARVFLMDDRVPNNPVLKQEHGMPSAAAYINTHKDDNFEMVFATSQRHSTTFSSILDFSHMRCSDRPFCTAQSPLLYCLPRHLSNSREFYNYAICQGFGQSSEAGNSRLRGHNLSWPTGSCVISSGIKTSSRNPPSIIVITTNAYGDVFFQEWEYPGGLDEVGSEQTEKLNNFMKQWQKAMESDIVEFYKPSFNPFEPENCSLILEASARGVNYISNMREESFNALTPEETKLFEVTTLDMPLKDRISSLRKYESSLAQRCLDVWAEDSDTEMDNLPTTIKEEPVDVPTNQFSDSDVEILLPHCSVPTESTIAEDQKKGPDRSRLDSSSSDD